MPWPVATRCPAHCSPSCFDGLSGTYVCDGALSPIYALLPIPALCIPSLHCFPSPALVQCLPPLAAYTPLPAPRPTPSHPGLLQHCGQVWVGPQVLQQLQQRVAGALQQAAPAAAAHGAG